MATVAEFTVESDVFPLGSVFSSLPGVTVELDRVVPRGTGVVPYFWVRDADVDDIVAKFADHPGVRDIRVVDEFETEYLMRCEWIADYAGILTGLAESDVVLLEAVGTEDQWSFEVRGDDRTEISDFHRYCKDHDIAITVTALYALTPTANAEGPTDAQREAIRLAFESGYFDTPRGTTLDELADELDVSQQAVSQRIRRGTRRLVANSLID